jgi:hypothetical protein
MRALALLLSCVAIGNVVLHDAVVAHARCAEHGELVDIHAHDADVRDVHDDIAHAGLHAIPGGVHGDADDHAHCPIASHPPRFDAVHVAVVAALPRVDALPVAAALAARVHAVRVAWRATLQTGPPIVTA